MSCRGLGAGGVGVVVWADNESAPRVDAMITITCDRFRSLMFMFSRGYSALGLRFELSRFPQVGAKRLQLTTDQFVFSKTGDPLSRGKVHNNYAHPNATKRLQLRNDPVTKTPPHESSSLSCLRSRCPRFRRRWPARRGRGKVRRVPRDVVQRAQLERAGWRRRLAE